MSVGGLLITITVNYNYNPTLLASAVFLNRFHSHSFGYDCLKRANLHVLAKDVVAFAAGNFVQVVNLKTKHHEYLRSTCGGGIGALMVSANPNLCYYLLC